MVVGEVIAWGLSDHFYELSCDKGNDDIKGVLTSTKDAFLWMNM